MLLTILLFSCDSNDRCIDADDFGNTQREIINVSASLTEVCYNSIKPDSYKNKYTDILPIATNLNKGDGVAPNALIDCLTNENLKGSYLTLEDAKKLVDGISTYKEGGKGCIDLDVNNYEERKLCETICELDCVNKNGKVIEASKLTTDKIWTANTPRKKDSSDGIDITPESNIFVSAAGEVNFRKTYESELASTIQPLDLTSFEGNKVVKLEFFGNYGDFNTQSYYGTTIPSDTQIGQMQGLARRSLVFSTPYNNPIPLNKTITVSEPSLAQPVNGVISHASTIDGFINFKMTKTANCTDAQIDVSIKKNGGGNFTYYKVTNLKLSEVYTTKNIPTYSDSIINIDITNNTIPSKPPEACIIKMKTQGYADTKIPYSGIAQFSKASTGSCKLFGRIINPDAEKMTYIGSNPADELIGINNNADSDKAFIVLSGNGFTYSDGAPFKVKNVYIGLNTYSNKDQKDLAVSSSCNHQLKELTNCKIESSSCSITSSDYSSTQLQGCKDGNGESGNIETGKSGNGGGGGGNLGGIKGSYIPNQGAGGNGQRGESYINPEFQLGEIGTPTPPATLENIKKGAAPSSGILNGGNGYVVFYWDKDKNIKANHFSYTSTNGLITPDPTTQIPSDNKKLHYEIYGGGGGAGGNCGTETGGEGGDGDYFSGILDFSNPSFLSGSTITLKVKVGSGGYSGKNCDITSLTNGSLNPDSIGTKLKGGNGGNDSSLNAGGGAGGSASYISLVREGREDFLVIAGGGGGGGGAKEIKGRNAKNAEIYSRSNELKSNANGYRLAVAIEALPVMEADFTSDYYEYDDFFTKTIVSSIDPLVSSIDPSRNIDVKSNYDDGFFVRKGQILRILPKSFDDAGCNGDISMKITLRPAVLCLDGISESIKNPNCTPNFPIGAISQQGCAPTSPCINCKTKLPGTPENEDLCPMNIQDSNIYCKDAENCAKITCTVNGDANNPNKECKRTGPPSTYTLSCDSGCSSGCASLRIAEMQKNPKIDITSSICYNFEDKTDISVNNFLKKYNELNDSPSKQGLVGIKKIKKIGNYDSTYKFGNFDNYTKSRLRFGFFETADPISFESGPFKSFLIKNNNFNEMSNIAYKDPVTKNYAISNRDNILLAGSEITVNVFNTPIQQKGRGLQVALCKESTETSNDCLHPDGSKILAYFIEKPNLETNAFRFNSFGILERGTGEFTDIKPNDGINISLCPNMASGNNFICYKTNDSPENIKKYRLIFRVKDEDNNYSNNSGEYAIKLEKKDSKNIGSGGVINGILQPIIENLDGVPAVDNKPERPGIVRNFYKQLTYNPIYRSILTLTMVLALSFYGMGYLMGVNELKHSEVVKILLKIGFIYLFTSTETGWLWFDKFFVGFFRNATDYIAFSVAETFDYENSANLKVMIENNNFYDRAVLFKSVDSVINLILAGAVQKKIMALLFSSIFGWLYFVIMYYCLLTYVYAVANSMLLYITCQIIITILFVLGPIFFIFLMFKVTKDMFDNWLKALIGFSLQQIFLVMTLALFNSFVVGFLKLALGYRVCWTKILSLNLYINRFTLLNFWTVAGTNAPDAITEDSPDESFGDTQNMPSIYLFLYLLVVISLMKKFIELFTDLAVTIAGGLKASKMASDSADIGKSLFKAASSVASKIFKNTAGRVISRIDNNLFDTGAIGSARRKAERQQFIEDVKTRNELKKVGDKAISEHKKNPIEAMKLTGMSVDKQKETLREVRQNAIKEYAKSKGIGSKELERITNASGLNYSGNNLFGMVAQAGKQAVTSGGNLFSSMNDEKINTSFSKSEANSALKKMNNDDQSKFIKAVKEGDVHVKKGKLENARKMPIVAVKTILNPKASIVSASKSAWSVTKKPLSTIVKKPARFFGMIEQSKADKLKSEVTKELENAGKITINQKPLLPKSLKEWARTDEEKLIIKNAVREKSRQQEFNLPKLTSESTIKDLEATQKLSQNTQKFTGAPLGKDNISIRAMAYRTGTRAKNLFSQDSEGNKKSKKAETMFEKNFIKLENERLKNENDPKNKNSIKNLNEALESKKESEMSYKDSDVLKRIYILEKARDSLKDNAWFSTNRHKISDEIKEEMKQNKMEEYVKKTEGIKFFGLQINPTKATLTKYLNEFIEKEFSKKPEIKQNRYEINEIKTKLEDAKKKDEKITEVKGHFVDAKKIRQEYQNIIDKYEKKPRQTRWGLAVANKIASAYLPVRFVARNTHSFVKSARDVKNLTVDSVNKFSNKESNRYKEEKGKTILSTPAFLSAYKEREKYKSALKAVKEFNNMQNPEKFVEKHQKILKIIKERERSSNPSYVGVSIGAQPPQVNLVTPPSTSTNMSN